MNIRTVAFTVFFALASSLTTGCAGFRIRAPEGFATLREQRPKYDFRAASAYGVAMAVRRIPNREHASLSFWSEAVDRHVRGDLGYAPLASDEVQTSHGVTGRRFEYVLGTTAHPTAVYAVTVFASRRAVYVIESGGATDAYARARTDVDRALRSFEPL